MRWIHLVSVLGLAGAQAAEEGNYNMPDAVTANMPADAVTKK